MAASYWSAVGGLKSKDRSLVVVPGSTIGPHRDDADDDVYKRHYSRMLRAS